MAIDWLQWHRDYDDPGSSLSRRLLVVQRELRRLLDDRPAGPIRLTTICAGEGRDVLPVLAESGAAARTRAVLVELDPVLADRARAAAAALGLQTGVEVRTADAGAADTYLDVEPADIVMACGVFGNVWPQDVRTTVAALPALLKPGGTVIWTRGRPDEGPDPSLEVRDVFAAHGFAEVLFERPDDARFRVGVHRLLADAERPAALSPGTRLFAFCRSG